MQRGVVVRLEKEGRREPVMMRWGLVPRWSKDDKKAHSSLMLPMSSAPAVGVPISLVISFAP